MKNNCFFTFIFVFYFITQCQATEADKTVIKIIKVHTSGNYNSTKIYNPIKGLDYWETDKLSKGEFVDWTAEMEEDTIIKALVFDFDYPPSKMIIYAGINNTHLLPIDVVDFSEIIMLKIKKKAIVLSKQVNLDYKNLVKFVKVRFINELNLKLSVQFLKFTVISDKEKGKFVISKLIYSSGKINKYCLKYDDEKNKLILVDCYYCVLYSFSKCQFIFQGTDTVGELFAHVNNLEDPFYLRKEKLDDRPIKPVLKENNQTVEVLSSFLSDEVDFSTELADILSNSTISSDYPVKNVMYDNLDYWSSNFTKASGCSGAEIVVKLKEMLVIRTIQIEWVQAPYSVQFFLCEADQQNCEALLVDKDFRTLKTMSTNIYIRAKEIRIVMGFDTSRLHDFSYECFCSIKKLLIFKNEIDLKPYEKEDDTNSLKRKKFYSDNFFLAKVNNLTSNNPIKIEEMYLQSVKNLSNIKNIRQHVSKHYVKLNSEFDLLISNLTGLNSDYSLKVVKVMDKIKKFELDLLTYHRINNQISQSSDDAVQVYSEKVEEFREIKSFFNDIKSYKNKLSRLYSVSSDQINALEEDLNVFLVDNSTSFSEAFSDKYVKEAILTSLKIKKLVSSINLLDGIERQKENLPFVEGELESLRQFTRTQLTDKLNFLATQYEDLYKQKSGELNSLVKNFEILLQNIKLIRLNFREIYLKMKSKCDSVQLVTNSFYDNSFVKILVSLTRENKNDFNIYILKFLNKNVFFYLKFNGYLIEVWKKKFEIEKMLFKYTNCTTEYDNYDEVENFSKLFYILVKVNNGKLSLMLRIDYTPIPEVIISHLNKAKESGYEKLVEIYQQNENHLNEYYSSMKMIYEKNDVDLYLSGNIALNSPKNNTKILMVSAYPNGLEKNLKEIAVSSLNTKFSYDFIQNVNSFPTVPIDRKIKDALGIDNAWKLYNSEFQVLDNFYLKFEVDINKLFTEEKNYSLEDFNLVESTILEEQQSSFYLNLSSSRSTYSYFLEVVRVERGFIFKWFSISTNSGRKVNIFRRRIEFPSKALKKNITFIFVKNRESLSIHVKFKNTTLLKNVFTLKAFQYIKFLFLMNTKNFASLSSIYMSDTYGGSFMHSNKKDKEDPVKSKHECTSKMFEAYKCIVKDFKVCRALFCKSCCSKKLLKVNKYEYNKCFKKCTDAVEKKY